VSKGVSQRAGPLRAPRNITAFQKFLQRMKFLCFAQIAPSAEISAAADFFVNGDLFCLAFCPWG
jgi:hypothetical protein